MITSSILSTYVKDEPKWKFNQWDIFLFPTDDPIEIFWKKYNFKYLFILSQDCDLHRDYESRFWEKKKDDKLLEYVLVCPWFPYGELISWKHINGKNMSVVTSDTKKDNILKNEDKRYHTIKKVKEWDVEIWDITLDFKFFFCIPTDILYAKFKKYYYLTLNDLYKNDLTLRFANFLSRIWLPDREEEKKQVKKHTEPVQENQWPAN